MATKLRIASFNCENLFSRPKIFSTSRERSLKLLDYYVDLQAELTKPVFDQNRIKDLKNELSGFVKINDVRGKHYKAHGPHEWFGWIELSRGKTNDMAVLNTARVIADVNADVICLVEVENRTLLQKFHDDVLSKHFLSHSKKQYSHIMLIDGNDNRGIDVSVMSRYPIDYIRSHIEETTTYNGKIVKLFSRDCLEVAIKLPDNKNLIMLANHFKSMGYSPPNDTLSNRRRKAQAKRVAQIASGYDLNQDFVVIAGDLNSAPDSISLRPIIDNPSLYNVNLELPEDERGTFRTGTKQLDYLFVSSVLRKHLKQVYIDRRGVYTRTNRWMYYKEVTNRRTEASDHAAVVADFEY